MKCFSLFLSFGISVKGATGGAVKYNINPVINDI